MKRISLAAVAWLGLLATAEAGGVFEKALPGNMQLVRAATECEVDEYEVVISTQSSADIPSLKIIQWD